MASPHDPFRLVEEQHGEEGASFSVTVAALLGDHRGRMFGGWSLALAAEAASAWAGRPVRALALDFVHPVEVGSVLRIEVEALRRGHRLSQCTLRARAGGSRSWVAQAVLGEPADASSGPDGRSVSDVWPEPPDAPPPAACPERTYRNRSPGTTVDSMDVRVVGTEPDPGQGPARVVLWARVTPAAGWLSPEARIAAVTDHVPYLVLRSVPGVRQVATVSTGLRLTGARPTGWNLMAIELAAADREIAIGRLLLWSEEGDLVAVSEQTVSTAFST